MESVSKRIYLLERVSEILPNMGKLICGMLDPTRTMIYISFHIIPSYSLNILRKQLVTIDELSGPFLNIAPH